ncbi:hypothetical protein [Erythrobacter sp. SG61-1L]|uniref:hypothetical protein n=1 Tax=Erythrobacter sp. SG61-1L TaxID=1603897 RepID=UPI0006C8F9CF|nr:hypothetical protein [Erythrobacter sp. SG61-1L]
MFLVPRSMITVAMVAFVSVASASPVWAAEDKWQPPACDAPVPVPAEWSGWETPSSAPDSGEIAVGTAWNFALAPVSEVALTGFDGKELPEGSMGAVLTFSAPSAGTYLITVADPMWIDVIGAKGVVESSAHGHGPDCSGIGKIVHFPLQPGTYRIELSAAQVDASRLMIKAP